MDELLAGVRRFRADVFPDRRSQFDRLSNGQSPRALFITCSDSRVVSELITQSEPGDLFICRNAGNIVPPHGQLAGSVAAAVEYAVMALKVPDIIVCGHTDCGAMKAALHPEGLEAMPAVAGWLHHAAAARRVAAEAMPMAADDTVRLEALTRANVQAQLVNLRTHPAVAASLAAGRLRVHGWIFDIKAGEVLVLDPTRAVWAPLGQAQADDVDPDLGATIVAGAA
ncbi:carbonic anhydrase [Arboricoccus pini]|uniref:Carbonic anhydrase n=1 Tax=Arboricoccus pini TaxID=1963835 RepID=A0A212QWJ7_9PROT|nr:carbonic anhydrase [Arboricoccus pini]SNB64089.1 carbonic anhydrase [Arboricoccus pini]